MKPAFRFQLAGATLSSVGQTHISPLYSVCSVRRHGIRSQSPSRQRQRDRSIHTSPPKEAPATALSSEEHSTSASYAAPERPTQPAKTMPPLSVLPFSQILRTYFITSISSSPRLLGVSTSILRGMLNSRSPLFRVDTNPLMRSLLWHTFYRQFCAGETETQVSTACSHLREQGYAGVILEYALEVLADAEGNEPQDVAVWRKGLLDTIHMAAPGDFVGLKWSGMGPAAMRRMKAEQEPSQRMQEAMHAVCTAAKEKGIALLPAAEETWSLTGFHDWCLRMQRAYNVNGKSVVYATYQAYLKQTAATVSQHLALAQEEGFTLGIKMVRGAYLGSDDRKLIHPTIEATHEAYDGIASALIHRQYNNTLKPTAPSSKPFNANINVMLASHNATTVQLAQSQRQQQSQRGETLTPITFAQLQGMADEVSCSLIAVAKANEHDEKIVKEKVFKCTTWGPMFDCLNYLLRRAAENKDAAGRTGETRRAMGVELWRRFRSVFGMA